jgi:hypothetical protein
MINPEFDTKRELDAYRYISNLFSSNKKISDILSKLPDIISLVFEGNECCCCSVTFENQSYTSINFKTTQDKLVKYLSVNNKTLGLVEVYFTDKYILNKPNPTLIQEDSVISLLTNTIALGIYSHVSGSEDIQFNKHKAPPKNNSKIALEKLIYENTERLKELKGLNLTSAILLENKPIEETLKMVCSILPASWQYPEHTAARITYEKTVFTTPNFKETTWVQRQYFKAPGNKNGLIEIFYLKQFPDIYEGPFLKEERELLINLANMLAGPIVKNIFYDLFRKNKERLKELSGINQTADIIAKRMSVEDTLNEIISILPKSWQYPKYTVIRIIFNNIIYTGKSFQETSWSQKENFITLNNKKGTVEVYYLKEFPTEYEGPFLKEERNLLINITKLICGYLNDIIGREIYRSKSLPDSPPGINPEEYRKSLILNKGPFSYSSINKLLINIFIWI